MIQLFDCGLKFHFCLLIASLLGVWPGSAYMRDGLWSIFFIPGKDLNVLTNVRSFSEVRVLLVWDSLHSGVAAEVVFSLERVCGSTIL